MKFGLPQYTLDVFFDKVLEKYPTRPSLASFGEIPFAYSEFSVRVNSLKSILKHLGIRKGDKIVLLGNSFPNWAITFMAATTMGAVAVPVLEEFPETDIDHIIRHSEAVGIFISGTLYENLNLNFLTGLKCVIKLNDFSLLSERSQIKSKILKEILQLPGKIIKSLEKSDSGKIDDIIQEDDFAEILYT